MMWVEDRKLSSYKSHRGIAGVTYIAIYSLLYNLNEESWNQLLLLLPDSEWHAYVERNVKWQTRGARHDSKSCRWL